jgi:hypothetical protein
MAGGVLGGGPAEDMTLTRALSGLHTATETLGGLVRYHPIPGRLVEDDR